MMNASKNTLALAVGSALAVGVSAGAASAADNPFALKPLASGYMVADNHAGDKMEDGKCGSGKCGSSMKKKAEKGRDDSVGIAKDGNADEKGKEGSCSGEKGKEGSCSGEKK